MDYIVKTLSQQKKKKKEKREGKEMEYNKVGPQIAHQVRVLAAKHDNLSSIPKTHVVEGKNRLTSTSCPMTSTHVSWGE